MENAGISDELIVNRALEPKDGSVVIAVLDGELTIKRLRVTKTGVVLQAENPKYPDIRVPAMSELTTGEPPQPVYTTSDCALEGQPRDNDTRSIPSTPGNPCAIYL